MNAIAFDQIRQSIQQYAALRSIHRAPWRSTFEGVVRCFDGFVHVGLKQIDARYIDLKPICKAAWLSSLHSGS